MAGAASSRAQLALRARPVTLQQQQGGRSSSAAPSSMQEQCWLCRTQLRAPEQISGSLSPVAEICSLSRLSSTLESLPPPEGRVRVRVRVRNAMRTQRDGPGAGTQQHPAASGSIQQHPAASSSTALPCTQLLEHHQRPQLPGTVPDVCHPCPAQPPGPWQAGALPAQAGRSWQELAANVPGAVGTLPTNCHRRQALWNCLPPPRAQGCQAPRGHQGHFRHMPPPALHAPSEPQVAGARGRSRRAAAVPLPGAAGMKLPMESRRLEPSQPPRATCNLTPPSEGQGWCPGTEPCPRQRRAAPGVLGCQGGDSPKGMGVKDEGSVAWQQHQRTFTHGHKGKELKTDSLQARGGGLRSGCLGPKTHSPGSRVVQSRGKATTSKVSQDGRGWK